MTLLFPLFLSYILGFRIPSFGIRIGERESQPLDLLYIHYIPQGSKGDLYTAS